MFSIRCLVFAKRNLFNYFSEREERRDIFLLKIEQRKIPLLKRKSAFPGRFGENVENVPFSPFSKSRESELKKLEPQRHMLLCGHDLN
jgi:hypothetical protein